MMQSCWHRESESRPNVSRWVRNESKLYNIRTFLKVNEVLGLSFPNMRLNTLNKSADEYNDLIHDQVNFMIKWTYCLWHVHYIFSLLMIHDNDTWLRYSIVTAVTNDLFSLFFQYWFQKPTSQVKKTWKKVVICLSDQPVKPDWASCQHSNPPKKTDVCEQVPCRPLETSWMHVLSAGGSKLRRSTIQQTSYASRSSAVKQVQPV